jgi:hypothetical protein
MVKNSFFTLNKMFKRLPMILMGVGLGIIVGLPAKASDEIYHGNFCDPINADLNKIQRNKWGINNISSSNSATVQCPFNLPYTTDLRVNSVYVAVYDRDPNLNVSCTLTGVSLDGTTLWERSSSSNGSSSAAQYLSFSPPNQFIATMNMTCSIPPVIDSRYSLVSTYRVITTP